MVAALQVKLGTRARIGAPRSGSRQQSRPMFQRLALHALVLGVVVISGGTALRAADDTIAPVEPTRAIDALIATCNIAAKMEERFPKMGLYEDGAFLVATNLGTSQARSGRFQFKANVHYVVMGWGDNSATDVDIRVADTEGNVIASDVLTDANPVVDFIPTETGEYLVEITLYAPGTDQNSSFCSMIILQSEGWSVPSSNSGDAIVNLSKVTRYVIDHEEGSVFVTDGDCWAVQGIVMSKGEVFTSTNVDPGNGRRVFVGAGDSHTIDLDNSILSPGGTVIVTDEATDAYPVSGWKAIKQRFTTKTSLVDADGASMVLQAILQTR